MYCWLVSPCAVGSKEKENQSKISEFLQEMQDLGIGDSVPPLLPTPVQSEVKGESSGTDAASRCQTDDAGRDTPMDRPSDLSPLEKTLMAEWVPLGLNFGIPLFSQEANYSVCDKASRRNAAPKLKLAARYIRFCCQK